MKIRRIEDAIRDPSNMRSWVEGLGDEDLMFVKRFVLASGSLKRVAAEYGISYPTVRLRLDRVIQKIRVMDDQEIRSPFERRLRGLYAEGRVDLETLRILLRDHLRALEERPLRQDEGEPT